MSVKMETDVGGVSRAPAPALPAARPPLPLAGAGAEPERPRCSSTPCSPVRGGVGVAGYQILHMDCGYLVGFATGEELLKRARDKRPGDERRANTDAVSAATPGASSPGGPRPKTAEAATLLHRAARVHRTKSHLHHYQPYDVPTAANGLRRRRRSATGSGDRHLRAAGGGAGGGGAGGGGAGGGGAEPGRAFHGPLPLCLLRGKRPHPHPKSLDYLNLDKMAAAAKAAAAAAALEPADTEVLQHQLQHLTLRGGDRMYARNKT